MPQAIHHPRESAGRSAAVLKASRSNAANPAPVEPPGPPPSPGPARGPPPGGVPGLAGGGGPEASRLRRTRSGMAWCDGLRKGQERQKISSLVQKAHCRLRTRDWACPQCGEGLVWPSRTLHDRRGGVDGRAKSRGRRPRPTVGPGHGLPCWSGRGLPTPRFRSDGLRRLSVTATGSPETLCRDEAAQNRVDPWPL